MLYDYGFVDRKLSPTYANIEIRDNKLIITDCSEEIYQFLCRHLQLTSCRREFELIPERTINMNLAIIEQYAIDYPDDAEARLLEAARPSQEEIKYLRFLLSKLQGKENRVIENSWKKESLETNIDIRETAKELLNPPKEESIHGWNQEQGNPESANPSEEFVPGDMETES